MRMLNKEKLEKKTVDFIKRHKTLVTTVVVGGSVCILCYNAGVEHSRKEMREALLYLWRKDPGLKEHMLDTICDEVTRF